MLQAIYLAGIAQSVILILALSALSVRKAGARWLLIALLAVFSLLLCDELSEITGSGSLGVGLALEFALGPLLYLFVRALVVEAPATRRSDLVFFIPLAVVSGLLLWLHLGFPGPGVSVSRPDMREIVASIVLIKIAWFFAFMVASVRVPLDADPPRRKALLPLRIMIILCTLVYSTTALSFVGFYFRLPWAPDSDQIGGVLLTLSVYAIGYFCLVNRRVFESRPRYSASPLEPGDAASLAFRAEQWLAASSDYRNPDYSLADLAAALNVGEARLSQALNASPSVGGFHMLIARHRVAAFREAAMEAGARDRTVLDLAHEVGFNSKATFYRAFQMVEGVTPSRFRAGLAMKDEQATRIS